MRASRRGHPHHPRYPPRWLLIPTASALVELTGQRRVTMVCQGAFELAVIDAGERQRRQGVDIEPADVERFQRRRWLDGAGAAAQEEQFVDLYRQGPAGWPELPGARRRWVYRRR